MKRSFLKIASLSCISLLVSLVAIAQDDNTGVEVARAQFKARQVIPPSPDAAELGKYGNLPVSLFTGTPNISIPLAELKGNVLSMPVSLSYNASGFKPDEIAPWTGLGWALNAGGVITRSVAGNPDVSNNYFTNPSPMEIPGTAEERQEYYYEIYNNTKETQPDMYYYNFMGYTGKFYIQPDGTIFQKERSMLQISNLNVSDTANTFTIKDDRGFTYEFTAREISTLLDQDDSEGAPPNKLYYYASAWYLTKVEAPYGGEEFILDYHSPTVSQQMFTNALQNEAISYKLTTDGDPLENYSISTYLTVSPQPTVTVKRKYLSRITYKKNTIIMGFIDLESALNERLDLSDAAFTGERLLKKIKLYSTVGTTNSLVKEFDLSYIYSSSTGTNGERRLLLQNIQEISINATPNKPPYTFFYNTAGTMPVRFTSSLDHWGFYNTYNNVISGNVPTLIPTVNVIGNTYHQLFGNRGLGANRSANSEGSTLCIINKITYPTGGYTTFEFEGHDAMFENTYNAVGGIRIKKMIDHSFQNKGAIVKKYDYTRADSITSGRIGVPFRYDNYSEYHQRICNLVGTTIAYSVTIGSNSIYSLGSIQGSHIGYERVTESQIDSSNNQPLGKTIYTYRVTGFMDEDDDIANGDLVKKQVFDNGGKLMQEETNTYQFYSLGEIKRRKIRPLAIQTHFDPTCTYPPAPPREYINDDYSIINQYKQLKEQVTTLYDQLSHSYLTSTKKITYNTTHMYPVKTEQSTSQGEVVITEKQYAADYPNLTGDNNSNGIHTLWSKNVLNAEIESVQYRQLANGTGKRYIGGVLTTYHETLPLPVKLYSLELGVPVTSHTMSTISGYNTNAVFNFSSSYKSSGTFLYNSYGNLIEQAKENDVVTSYVWGFNQSYPVAQVLGSSSSSVLAYITDATIQDMATSDATMRSQVNNVRTNIPGALVNGYTYKPFVGITSQSDINNRITFFEYDGLGRSSFIKDHDGNIVKNFIYNYGLGTAPTSSAQALFYSAEQTGSTYTKQTSCAGGTILPTIIYKVPYGKYVSTVDQTTADALAIADRDTNGQAAADALPCLFGNILYRPFYQKNDCSLTQGTGNFIRYTVTANTFMATSQDAANLLATNNAVANGQAYANANAGCSCSAEGEMYINNTCETGERINLGSYYENGQWRCVYFYQFSDRVSQQYEDYSAYPCPLPD